MTEKEMQIQQKQEVQQAGEPTKPEKQYVPAVDIFETAEAVNVLAEMPGVAKEGVEIELENETLTIRGVMAPVVCEGETVLLQEFQPGSYLRKFTVAETIDQEKIQATMADGVLTLVLPKLAPAKPRRIEVRGS
ncbi:Hsp20/alpha crystallin family protein [Thiovibrio frasassiensis]|jgi:HSP20 family protein|uniref:Hsp20/alpha crystallin family protein n=1 Tax=Thiovibrio frasassiensis TaxID=2984131 RepID=A0A9X4RKK6_9BACT|nr:Hsp20/alpha crystallin family protein [Thiovibrio frasassiensis]MDG4474620.1 Hsp20/alpha crystallin family protein [Thiovibrio frasassiensis]